MSKEKKKETDLESMFQRNIHIKIRDEKGDEKPKKTLEGILSSKKTVPTWKQCREKEEGTGNFRSNKLKN